MNRTMALLIVTVALCSVAHAQPTRDDALAALRQAGAFYHQQVSTHGGYVWQVSGDLKLRKGEGLTDEHTIWVQPPGTTEVGLAFMDAYYATGEQMFLDAAVDVAHALVQGQLVSGGWYYSISFDPAKRGERNYRVDAPVSALGPAPPDPEGEGWHLWRQRKEKGNITILDDNNSASAMRLLAQVDQALEFGDAAIHEAVMYALDAISNAQYPVGAWGHNYCRYPNQPPGEERYPIIPASVPLSSPESWPNAWNGCYFINDNVTPDVCRAYLEAWWIYRDERYLRVAQKAGVFMLLAQMPEPQPAWCQQYDENMQPVWDRKFEPPAITGYESQGVMEALLRLYRYTGQRKWLDPIPRAIEYMRASLRADGRLARFYELQTNRPLYFTKDYQLTYSDADTPKHYGFAFDSRLDEIEAEYERLSATPREQLLAPQPAELTEELATQVELIIAAMDGRGAWVQEGRLKGYKVEQTSGVIDSQTFSDNVRALCRFIRAHE